MLFASSSTARAARQSELAASSTLSIEKRAIGPGPARGTGASTCHAGRNFLGVRLVCCEGGRRLKGGNIAVCLWCGDSDWEDGGGGESRCGWVMNCAAARAGVVEWQRRPRSHTTLTGLSSGQMPCAIDLDDCMTHLFKRRIGTDCSGSLPDCLRCRAVRARVHCKQLSSPHAIAQSRHQIPLLAPHGYRHHPVRHCHSPALAGWDWQSN